MSFGLRSLTYPDLLARAAGWLHASWPSRRSGGHLAARPLGTHHRLAQGGQHAANHHRWAQTWAKTVYGDHPDGQEMTEATLQRIGVADMRRCMRACWCPAGPR